MQRTALRAAADAECSVAHEGMTMFRFRVERFGIVGLLIFAWLISVLAQRPCLKEDEGKVVGHLRDVRCKSDIAKAAIRIKGEKIERESKSDSRGNFVFCVPPGLYE
jgi:hypothetical protein